ncbi:molybdopterin-dependent oxidoreductase [Deinococcus sonorensis]|uniref:Molybdopterin-dependent oxidoreductase n=2 Tax=Deinococcus sonorensis TaxID=309891 RepID=A0AAU7UCW8_9DEIO
MLNVRRRVWVSVLVLAVLALSVGLVMSRQRSRATDGFVYLHGVLKVAASADQTVLLTLRGPGGQRRYTRAQLEALPAVRYRAFQPQLKQDFEYVGVPLRDLAALVGLTGQPLQLQASDNFSTTIQPNDYQDHPVMLAYQADGHPIDIQQKGPLLAVFPNLDEPARFPNPVYGSRWAWYVERIGGGQ